MRLAREGRIRVPEFQRSLKWEAEQVVDLFDSVYRGYPIGSLLLFKRRAPASRVHLGPLIIEAPEQQEALWVADGQQRLVALAASFARSEPYPTTPVDPFVLYFDAEKRVFRSPLRTGETPESWIRVPLLLDATKLSEWIHSWPRQADLRAAAFEAGKRLREYQVPLYLIDSDDAQLLSEIFARINTSGKPMKWAEVHDALYGHSSPTPSTTLQLSEALADVGMGRLGVAELTSCLLAIRGLDVTQTLAVHRRRQPDVLRNAVADALPVLRQTLSFLRQYARVPHLRFLPRSFVLESLGRFFTLHPDPRPRSIDLLTRWVWRVFLAEGAFDERTLRRRSVVAITDDEEASLQTLLGLAPRDAMSPSLPERFDARAARSRLALLALAELSPQALSDGRPVDLSALAEQRGSDAFRPIEPVRPKCPAGLHGAGNRILLPGTGSARQELFQYLAEGKNFDGLLASHAIDEPALELLKKRDSAGFADARSRIILGTLASMGERLAGWGREDRDRPSINYLRRLADGP